MFRMVVAFCALVLYAPTIQAAEEECKVDTKVACPSCPGRKAWHIIYPAVKVDLNCLRNKKGEAGCKTVAGVPVTTAPSGAVVSSGTRAVEFRIDGNTLKQILQTGSQFDVRAEIVSTGEISLQPQLTINGKIDPESCKKGEVTWQKGANITMGLNASGKLSSSFKASGSAGVRVWVITTTASGEQANLIVDGSELAVPVETTTMEDNGTPWTIAKTDEYIRTFFDSRIEAMAVRAKELMDQKIDQSGAYLDTVIEATGTQLVPTPAKGFWQRYFEAQADAAKYGFCGAL